MKIMQTKFDGEKSFKGVARKMLSLGIALSLLTSSFPFEASAVGLPVVAGSDTINIGIASDVHISRDDSASNKVRESLLHQCLKGFYAATSNNLDAVAIAGDLTDNGFVDELQTARSIVDSELASTTMFTAVMGNHEFYKYGAGASVDKNTGWKEEMQKDFTNNIKVLVEQDNSVKGVHIISVSPDNELDSYTARESFLRAHIEAAAIEAPTNPIILIVHKPVKYTVMSSGDGLEDSYATYAADWSDSFSNFLKQYPQIIYYSGHAHDDLSNPDNIFQKDFTSIQDGVVSAEGASTGVLVSIDANKVVTINRMNFSTNTCYEPWTIDIPKVIESKENFEYSDTIKNVNLTVGANASELHVNWFNKYYKTGKVQFAKKSDMVNGAFSSPNEVTAYGKGKVDYSTFYYNHALLTNLKENTEYAYRVGNENGWSEYYTYKTPASSDSLNFMFAADPQIGSTDVDSDAAGWKNTLDKSLVAYPNAQFLLSAGDHVNNALGNNEYDAFFSPSQLTALPLATVVGNHDISVYYSQHFAYSNVSANTSLKLTGENSGDYWFVRNDTLFLMLNSSVLDSQEHINFMQQAILDAQKTGKEIKWKVAMFHYSIFSTAMHSDEVDILARRASLAPAFSDLQVDLVLMGHDHLYTRTYMMNGTTPILTDSVQNSVTNPEAGQVLYVTGSSSSGSKFYDAEAVSAPYAVVNYKNGTPSISNVEVSDTALAINTYNSTDMTLMDSFTINKTQSPVNDTLKPYLFVPTTNTVILNEAFDKLAGVTATDNVDGDITDNIIVTGDVNTAAVGTYTLNYSITDNAGNTKTATREVIVKKQADTTGGLYYGMNIKNGKLENEAGSTVTNSTYTKTSGGYEFENDTMLNQNVLCGPDKGNLRISGLNLKALDNQYTIETYVKIPEAVTEYNLFQFENQSINVVGRPCENYPGETYFGAGKTQITEDADVYARKKIPTDKWTHILCTAKEGEQTLYVNGEKFSSDSYTKLNISIDSNDVLVLGGNDGDRSGLIKFACFRVYTNFVNDEQAKKLYTTRTKLKTPEGLKWDTAAPAKALWEAVGNASSYNVQLLKDGLESGSAVTGITDSSYDFTPVITAEGVYTFKVTAIGKNTAYSNSDTSSKSGAYFYATSADALKPSISIPTANDVVLNGTFDKLADVSAVDKVDGDITNKIVVTGDVDTSVVGEYTLTYTVTNSSGITATATRRVVVKSYFYFGIDIKNGKRENEKYFKVTDSTYERTGDNKDNIYLFEKDNELNQNVLCGPEKENMVINKLNLKGLGNKFTVETYIKIPGNIGAYDVFQFDGQNVNLVGVPGETYFGAGRYSGGDADVWTDNTLPVDQWIHVICTAKAGVQTLYVNGEEFSSDIYPDLNIASTANEDLVLGGSSAGRSGLIKYACFRIYSDFVFPEDVQKMYTAMTTLSTPEALKWDMATPGKATWGAVTNAGSYEVQLYKDGVASGSKILDVKNNDYDFTPVITEKGSYTFEVTAIGNGTIYKNSNTSSTSGAYSYTPVTKLTTPGAIEWDMTTPGKAIWGAVENASSYAVQLYKDGVAIGSKILNVKNNYYDFTWMITATGVYTFEVKAIGNGTTYSDSDASSLSGSYSYNAPVVKLTTPGAIEWNMTTPGKATWGAVDNASSYEVQLYKDGVASGSKISDVKNNYYDFTPVITATGSYTFEVKAIGNGTIYSDSDTSSMSSTYSYNAPATPAAKLSTPGAIEWDMTTPGKATWGAVENASSYSVQLYKDGSASGNQVSNVTNTYYDFTPVITATGSYTFEVKAIGNGITYGNSDTSTTSAAYSYTVPTTITKLSTPGAIEWDMATPGKATWGAVENASSYAVQLYKDGSVSGSEVSNVTNTYYDFTSVITATGSYTFEVKAIGNGITYGNSDTSSTSAAYSYTVPTMPNSNSGGNSTSSGSTNTDNSSKITVNGKLQNTGTSKTTTSTDGQTVTTITVDTDKLKNILESERSGATVEIRVTDGSDVAACVLTGEMVKNIENKEATLVVQNNSATYKLPASRINIDAVSKQFGEEVSLSDITVTVKIAEPSDKMMTVIERATKDDGLTIIVPAVEFTISCTHNGKMVDVNSFDAYVERLIAIPDGVDPAKITTGIVVKLDGKTYPVPTQVVVIEGVYYAKINSLTNSTYTVVYHPVQFADVGNHWAKDTINDMGSRMIVYGDKNGNYNANNNITRAEFATLIVRALGLTSGNSESNFSDVASESWYCGYIKTASEYGIITGYEDGRFGPNNLITREQAMTMIVKAMKLTGLEVSLTDSEIYKLLETWSDAVSASDYAEESIAACLQAGIVSGKGTNAIAPKDHTTRAEAIVMIERLLKKSRLI